MVWYQETTFSQMVSYDFLLHGPLHGYFLYLVSAPPEKPTRRCELEENAHVAYKPTRRSR